MGTIIGTPPNALFVGYMMDNHNIEISFFRWMMVGIPLVLVLLPITFFLLTRFTFNLKRGRNLEASDVIKNKLAALGKTSRAEWMITLLMGTVALLWIFRRPLNSAIPDLNLSDAGIAMTGAVLLFMIPVDLKKSRFLLTWKEAVQIPWDVLFLFGGGLALAAAIGGSDLAAFIGSQLKGLSALPIFVLLLGVGVLIVFVGELASNTAMAAVFLPVAGATAISMGAPPILLTLPVALFATLGFMLPVATPPNAIIFGSGVLEMKHMLRAGIILDLIGIVVAALGVIVLGQLLLG
jgi:sodium-dependent dicarboxylate transporter 2/3/5